MKLALRHHPDRPEAIELAGEMAAWLGERGHEVVDDVAPADLVVSIGGDGTMLRAVDEAARHGVPVLGVNVGQLGYLTEVDPKLWKVALEQWEAGRSTVVERMLLAVRVERSRPDTPLPLDGDAPDPLPDGTFIGLNEVVVEKTPTGKMVRIGVVLDGERFTTYAADGIVVATPTGSTAYALSARGPIADPTLRALVLVAVAPHSLFDRALVLSPAAVVRLEVEGDRPTTVSLDGRTIGPLSVGDAVVATAAEQPAKLLTFGDRNFHGILKQKFGLADR